MMISHLYYKMLTLLVYLLYFFSPSVSYLNDSIMVLSVSSDGQYAVSSSFAKRVVLWDLKHKTWRLIFKGANIYSAYFIKHTHDFMWQGIKDNRVYIENTSGHLIKSFKPGFASYGEVMTSDLKRYYAADDDDAIYSYSEGTRRILAKPVMKQAFFGDGKLITLSLSTDDHYLLSSSTCGEDNQVMRPLIKLGNTNNIKKGCVILWDLNSQHAIAKLGGNIFRTVSDINNNTIITSDEDGYGNIYTITPLTEKYTLWDIYHGKETNKKNRYGGNIYDKRGLIKLPLAFLNAKGMNGEAILWTGFIDDSHFLRVATYIPYAILYNINNPKPEKYFPLGKNPMPQVDDYSADQSIDTAPMAQILVMSNYYGGINVYHYDNNTKTLKRIWISRGPMVLEKPK